MNAVSLTVDVPSYPDTTGAASDGPADGCGFTGASEGDVWYQFTAPCDKSYDFRLTSLTNPPERMMAIYDAAAGCPTTPNASLACGESSSSPIELRIDLNQGDTVLIRVATPGLGGSLVSELIVTPYCAMDLNNDGVVDVADLLEYFNIWSTCPDPCPWLPTCTNPISGLLALFDQWGPCP